MTWRVQFFRPPLDGLAAGSKPASTDPDRAIRNPPPRTTGNPANRAPVSFYDGVQWGGTDEGAQWGGTDGVQFGGANGVQLGRDHDFCCSWSKRGRRTSWHPRRVGLMASAMAVTGALLR
jgi:hypothetical protein